jgi:two-component system sensor histidine kinase RegB
MSGCATRDDVGNRDLLIALMLDVVALTPELYLTGGASNPFTCLYLLQVTLGAVLLDARSSWSLVALTVLSFIWLTIEYRPLELPHRHAQRSLSACYVTGMFVGLRTRRGAARRCSSRASTGTCANAMPSLADLRQHAAEQDHIIRMGPARLRRGA